MNYFYIYLITTTAVISAHYIHGFIFARFKADRYEDVLAGKIAKAIVREMREKGLII